MIQEIYHSSSGSKINLYSLSLESRASLLEIFLDNATNTEYLAEYLEKYRLNLINNTLNSYIKGVVKH